MNIGLTFNDFAALSPLLILMLGALAILLIESFASDQAKKFSAFLALVTILATGCAVIYAPSSTHPRVAAWIQFDTVYRFFSLFFLATGFGCVLLAISFFNKFKATQGEYFFFFLSALFGLILIGASADFLTLFLGIETLSLSLYVLCGYMKKWELSHEAALKYFLIGALATAFFLYGIALIYGAIGTTQFADLLGGYQGLQTNDQRFLFLSGISLVTLGLAFKAAIVPFHIWAPDVYEGAPTPVTAFMAVAVKAGAFAAFTRLFLEALPHFYGRWNEGMAILAYATLIYANFVALRQTQLRRFFAYSGISHAGFLLIAIVVGTSDAFSALVFYLVVYSLATLGAFAVIAFLEQERPGMLIRHLHGLFYRSPFLALTLVVCLLTLAGLPPTAGFFAKFYLFKLAFQTGYYGLVIVGLLTTVLAVFYYLRILGMIFVEDPTEVHYSQPLQKPWPAFVLGGTCLAGIALISFYPSLLLG